MVYSMRGYERGLVWAWPVPPVPSRYPPVVLGFISEELTLVERMTCRQSHLTLCQRSALCTNSNDVMMPRSSAVFAIGSQSNTER